MGRRQKEKAERKRAARLAGVQPDPDAVEPRLKCPQCGSTNLSEGDQAFEGRFVKEAGEIKGTISQGPLEAQLLLRKTP